MCWGSEKLRLEMWRLLVSGGNIVGSVPNNVFYRRSVPNLCALLLGAARAAESGEDCPPRSNPRLLGCPASRDAGLSPCVFGWVRGSPPYEKGRLSTC